MNQQALQTEPGRTDNISYMALSIVKPKTVVNFNQRATAYNIIDVVCKYFDVTEANITSKWRFEKLVKARCIAMKLIKMKTAMTLKEIGQLFSGRDHTTVIHAIRAANNWAETDEAIAQIISHLQKMI